MTCDHCGYPLEEDVVNRPADAPYDEREMVCIMAGDDDEGLHTHEWFKVDLIA